MRATVLSSYIDVLDELGKVQGENDALRQIVTDLTSRMLALEAGSVSSTSTSPPPHHHHHHTLIPLPL